MEDSLSSFKDKITRKSLENIISALFVELSYSLIYKFWHIFKDKASTKKISTCKNVDEYKNIMRSFHARLTLFVKSSH